MKLGSNLKSLIKIEKEEQPTDAKLALRFVTDLYSSMEISENKNKRLPSKTYKPSSMICPRNMYFQRIGEEQETEKFNASMKRIGECGTASHDDIQKHIAKMKENGIDCDYIDVADFVKDRNLIDLEIVSKVGMETKLYNKKHNISFMCDGIVRYLNEYFIFEFKTEVSFKFNPRNEMDSKHIPQICAYYLSFGINRIIMLYENRDLCGHKAYIKEVTDEMVWEHCLSKIEEVENCIELNTIPSTNRTRDCQWCKYSKKCKILGG